MLGKIPFWSFGRFQNARDVCSLVLLLWWQVPRRLLCRYHKPLGRYFVRRYRVIEPLRHYSALVPGQFVFTQIYYPPFQLGSDKIKFVHSVSLGFKALLLMSPFCFIVRTLADIRDMAHEVLLFFLCKRSKQLRF